MNLQDQDCLWLTDKQRSTKERNVLDPFALYGFYPNPTKPSNRRVKSALPRTTTATNNNYSQYYGNKIKNRNHPPGYETPDFHVGHNPTPTPATSRPASSRSGYSSARLINKTGSSPTALYLGSQRNRCKSAPPKHPVYIPRRSSTSKSKASTATVRGAPQRAWELRTNSVTNYTSLLSPKEIKTRNKTRCKSAPLPYDFSSVELINEVDENATDYERLCAMTRPFSCMPDLVKNAINHNGLRHCCSAYNTRTIVPPETRQQFWPVRRPGVYRRGFVPQYFSFVKPAQYSGDSAPPAITCTKPDEQQTGIDSEDFDEAIIFEDNFAYPDTPSELSITEQLDLSDDDNYDDDDEDDNQKVREYLETRLSCPDDDDDLQFLPEPVNDEQETNSDLGAEDNQTQDIGIEIVINQSLKMVSPEPVLKQDLPEVKLVEPEPEPVELDIDKQEELYDIELPSNEQETSNIEQLDPVEELPETPCNLEITNDIVENTKVEEIKDVPEEKPADLPQPKPLATHPDPPKVTFIDSMTVTSYKTTDKKVEPSKPILKQPKPPPPPQQIMDEKTPKESTKKPKPRPTVERREADIKPQVKPGIVIKPEPPKEEKEETETPAEEEEQPKSIEEKLPEPEFVQAPGAYRMYQAVDLHQHELAKAKLRNKIHSRQSQSMPLPNLPSSNYHMLPESAMVMNSVMEDERRKREGMKPWLQGRLALSKQTSRFELPMDVTLLESMTAMEYLTKYCIISTRRKALFKQIFQKVDKDRDGIIGFRELEKGLKEIHVDSIDIKQVRSIVEMIGADEKTKFNLKQFSAIAALSERILFSNFVTEETKNINNSKEIIEEADFCSLKWKLDGLNVNPTVRNILESL